MLLPSPVCDLSAKRAVCTVEDVIQQLLREYGQLLCHENESHTVDESVSEHE